MTHYYAGIGSRKTPLVVQELMTAYAEDMRCILGWVLRSGGAEGADQAFEDGAKDLKEIFYAKDATPKAIELASKYHPNWKACSTYAKHLHGRNCQILLGRNLDKPVERVICWTPKGEVVGGTGMALRLANAYNIPVLNFGKFKLCQ